MAHRWLGLVCSRGGALERVSAHAACRAPLLQDGIYYRFGGKFPLKAVETSVSQKPPTPAKFERRHNESSDV